MPNKKHWSYANPKGFGSTHIKGGKAKGTGMHPAKGKGRAGQKSGMKKRTGGKMSGY